MSRFYIKTIIAVAALLPLALTPSNWVSGQDQRDPLASWNDGPAKKAIIGLVKATTEKGSPKYLPPEERIATFDEDGTTWVEHPMYTEVVFSLDRLVELAPKHPEWKDKPVLKAAIDGDRAALAKFDTKDLLEIIAVTHSGVTAEEFHMAAKDWIVEGEGQTLESPLHRTGLPADDRGDAVSACQWLQDIHCDWRNTTVRPRVR